MLFEAHQPLVAAGQALSTFAQTPLLGSLLGSLSGVTTTLVTAPAHAESFTLNPDGSFIYTASPGFSGDDSFVYRARDAYGFTSEPATITIAVVGASPIVADGHDYTTSFQTTVAGNLQGEISGGIPPLTTELVAGPGHAAAFTLNPDGSFTYTPAHGFTGDDSFVYRARDASGSASNPATVSITVTAAGTGSNPVVLTGGLDPASDTGRSDFDGITSKINPTYLGTATPGALVQLLARQTGQAGFLPIGEAVAGPDGLWRITTVPLADGSYELAATATAPAPGASAPGATLGLASLLVDTVSPWVVAARLLPRAGRIALTFQDNLSGLDPTRLADAGNYTVGRPFSPVPHREWVSDVEAGGPTAMASTAATTLQSVNLVVSRGRSIRHARLVLAAHPDGIRDLAGNSLAGRFTGRFPTRGAPAGTRFAARFDVAGFRARPARAMTTRAENLDAARLSVQLSPRISSNA